MFNSRQYEFADITLFMGGKDVGTLRSIKYTIKQEKEAVYGKGNKPLSIQRGNISYEGEVKILQSDYEALRKSGGGSVLNLSLGAIVNYGNPTKGDMILTDVLSGIQFTEESKEFKQGDKYAEITLPFIALDITNKV